MSFAVVEFLHEEAVEVVHKSWIVKDDNVSFLLKMVVVHALRLKK